MMYMDPCEAVLTKAARLIYVTHATRFNELSTMAHFTQIGCPLISAVISTSNKVKLIFAEELDAERSYMTSMDKSLFGDSAMFSYMDM